MIRWFVLLCLIPIKSIAQVEYNWEPISSITQEGLRGLSVVNDTVAWASGQHGTFLKTTNGVNWKADTIDGASAFDFRDIEAFDANTAIVLSAGAPAKIYRTINGGASWTETYSNTQKGIFFDGMDFWNSTDGIAYSDPIDGKLVIIITQNGGKSWEMIDPNNLPDALENEAGFAASGTGVCTAGDSTLWITTGGGKTARVFKSVNRGITWSVVNTPLLSGKGQGIFSITFMDKKQGIIVGGSYIDSTNTEGNCAISINGGLTWKLVDQLPPNGYRSCVGYLKRNKIVFTVGRTGSEFSDDLGTTWKSMGNEGYYACDFAYQTGWAVGRGGKMARLKITNTQKED